MSCRELTTAYLDAVKRDNPALNAYILLTEEEALRVADAVDARRAKGEMLSPLEGVPFALKDCVTTKGIATTCASKMLADYIPFFDAFIWEKLREQNAVMIGKGNMDEFAMGSTGETSYFGPASNPHNLDYVPGGSSSGVAAAVAGGLAVFGIGSDTGGSVRIPAAFCGLVGLKPTYGAVSRRGVIAYGSSLDQIGPIAACAEDAALVFDAINAKDPGDMTSVGSEPVTPKLTGSVAGMKIGMAKEFFEVMSPAVREAIERSVKLFEKMGAEIVSLDFPMLRYTLSTYYIIACAEAASNLGKFDGLRYGYRTDAAADLDDFICRTRTEGFGQEVRRRILLGTYVLSAGYYDAYYNKAQQLRRAIKGEFAKMFKECDLLLGPTVATTALKKGSGLTPVEMYQTDICTSSVNLAGLPAVSVPCGFDEKGLPIGLQLVGPHFKEDRVLSAALAFERETAGEYLRASGMGVKL
jgi:aspartyl-tRNA(Asn)/glutamyl-tRNA(Gln) amidotransferase subunit A